jgi:hypothetical protein
MTAIPKRQSRATLVASLLTLALAAPLSAQIVRGSVIDTTTGLPIAGATIALRTISPDSSVAGAVSDSAGNFSVLAPTPGIYLIAVRKIGYQPIAGPPRQLDTGQVRPVRFEMGRNVTTLDSVVRAAERSAGPSMTKGEIAYNRHALEGKGMFFAGLDVKWSKIRTCDYFAKLPGLTWSPSTPGATGIRCLPENQLVTAKSGQCLAARVDHQMFVAHMDSATVFAKPSASAGDTTMAPYMFPIEEIRGVEVYRTRDELPKDFVIPAAMDRSVQALSGGGGQRDATSLQSCVWIQIWTGAAW